MQEKSIEWRNALSKNGWERPPGHGPIISIILGSEEKAIQYQKKLENQGVISNYVALLDKESVDKSFTAFCHVKLVQHSKDYVVKFEREVAKLQEVLECYHISGDYDYILKVLVKDMQEFREFMVKKLTSIDHIGSTHSMFAINEVKHTTTITI